MQVSNTISLSDKMTPTLHKIVDALKTTTGLMKKMDSSLDWGELDKEIRQASRMLDKMDNELKQINNSQKLVKNGFAGWKTSISDIAGGIYAVKSVAQGIGSIANVIDTNTSVNARLNLIRDDSMTEEQMQGLVFTSAQNSRSSYNDQASAIAKLSLLAGDGFANNSEIAQFTNLMSKSFKISGASTQEQQAGMYQLTQAMAAGKLQGDEFRSIMENAPMLAQAIADFTGKSKGDLKEMSAEGTITADIMKGALFSAADDIEARYEKMPVTFGEVATMFKNELQIGSQEALGQLGALAESGAIQNLANTMLEIATAGIKGFGWLGKHINGVSIVLKIGLIAWMSYKAGVVIASGANNVYAISTLRATAQTHGLRAALLGQVGAASASATATNVAAGAQRGLNIAMAANPIGLVVMAIGTLVGALGTLALSYNQTTEAANAATQASANFMMISGIGTTDLEGLSIQGEATGTIKRHGATKGSSGVGARATLEKKAKAKDVEEKKGRILDFLENGSDNSFNAMMDYVSGEKSTGEAARLFRSWGLSDNDRAQFLEIMKKAETGRQLQNFDMTLPEIPALEDYDIGNVDNVGTVDKVNDSVDISDESLRYLSDAMVRSYVNKINVNTMQPNFSIEFTGDITQNADADRVAEEIIAKAKEKMYSGVDDAYEF